IQMHGATGISHWTPLAEMYQDVRHLRFADGPDEVHWMVVGRHELSMQYQRRRAPRQQPRFGAAAVLGSAVSV
uniref:acyl-CoA dehydrogenase family protein n=1 Tax=Stenotrophomonas maltophilia TaxID=40324 RepID=UPI0023B830CE